MHATKGRKQPQNKTGEKYLAFTVGGESYAVPVRRVSEIVGYIDITAVAGSPQHVKGLLQLRERTVTVIDLRTYFRLPPAERNHDACIIIVNIESGGERYPAGIVVDQVGEVETFGAENTIPTNTAGGEPDFIAGISRVGDRTTALLDVDRLLSSDELAMVTRLQRAA